MNKSLIKNSEDIYLIEKNSSFIFDRNLNFNISLKSSINDPSLDIEVLENSNLNLNFISNDLSKDVNFNVILNKNSDITLSICDFTSINSKYNINLNLKEGDSNAKINLFSLSAKETKKRYDIFVLHSSKNTTSEVKVNGVSKEESNIIINTTTHIKENSTKSNASQKIRVALFDDSSSAIGNPILKIDNNDVKASHGCAIGAINDEHIYYFLSRGVSKEEAKNILCASYLLPSLIYFNKKDQEELKKTISGEF